MDCFLWLDFKRNLILFLVLLSAFGVIFHFIVADFGPIVLLEAFWLVLCCSAFILFFRQRKKIFISYTLRPTRCYFFIFSAFSAFSVFLLNFLRGNDKAPFFLAVANFFIWQFIYLEKIYLFNHIILAPNIAFALKADRHAELKLKISGYEKLIFYLSWHLLKSGKIFGWQKGECCLRIFPTQTNYFLYNLSDYCLLYRPFITGKKTGGEFLIEFIVLPVSCVTEKNKFFGYFNYRRRPQFQLKLEKYLSPV